MENTLENKTKFFAQYWGQTFVRTSSNGKPIKSLGNSIVINYENADKFQRVCFSNQRAVLLKRLDSISDEDAIAVASLILGKEVTPLELVRWSWQYRVIVNREKSIQDENTEIEMHVSITYDTCEVKFTWDYNNSKGSGQQNRHCPNAVSAYDYLRSKGYALPWMDLSVEKQEEYGWIKIK